MDNCGDRRIDHTLDCFLYGRLRIVNWDIDAWNRRYTDDVAGEGCKVTKEVRE